MGLIVGSDKCDVNQKGFYTCKYVYFIRDDRVVSVNDLDDYRLQVWTHVIIFSGSEDTFSYVDEFTVVICSTRIFGNRQTNIGTVSGMSWNTCVVVTGFNFALTICAVLIEID